MKGVRLRLLLAGFALAVATQSVNGGEGMLTKSKKKERGQPTETHALVYIVRPQSLGGFVRFWAYADEVFMAVTRGESYSFALVPEGERLFWSRGETITTLRKTVKAGETYYLRQEVNMGAAMARVRLIPVSEAEGEKAIKGTKYAVPTESGRQRAAEISDEFWNSLLHPEEFIDEPEE